MNRLELLGETMRAALNFLSKLAPEWIKMIVKEDWYKRYGHRVENSRLPKSETKKHAYAILVGQNGFKLLDALRADQKMSSFLDELPIKALRTAWNRHFSRDEETNEITLKSNKEIATAKEKIESPYDQDARFRTKRNIVWTGYMVHLTETCDDQSTINIVTHVRTTPADVHDVHSTPIIHADLVKIGLAPKTHLVDTAYINLDLLVSSKNIYDIDLIGPPKEGPSWRSKVDGAYTLDSFTIDWKNKTVQCPGNQSSSWWYVSTKKERPYNLARFSSDVCKKCPSRDLCIKPGSSKGRQLHFPQETQYLARENIVGKLQTKEGKKLYDKRAGIEGTMSQATRAGLRRSRYKSLRKTHLQ